MKEEVIQLVESVKAKTVAFSDVIQFIDSHYQYQPTAFKNGDAYNEATQNQGSARVFAFAKLHDLTQEDTLNLFVEHYQAVLNTPDAADHQNIRQFMVHGWQGIAFDGEALVEK